jgi:hypothetical protein
MHIYFLVALRQLSTTCSAFGDVHLTASMGLSSLPPHAHGVK